MPIQTLIGMQPWCTTCRVETCSFFLRKMKNSCNRDDVLTNTLTPLTFNLSLPNCACTLSYDKHQKPIQSEVIVRVVRAKVFQKIRQKTYPKKSKITLICIASGYYKSRKKFCKQSVFDLKK